MDNQTNDNQQSNQPVDQMAGAPVNQPTKPISDDQELAKVLAGISKEPVENFDFDDAPKPGDKPADKPADDMPKPPPVPAMPSFSMPPFDAAHGSQPMPVTPPVVDPEPSRGATNLDGIRKDALTELRPLVDKLDLAPEEKFDIYLLLLRSTDDTALIAPAHNAAKNIADEAKRAQALLDIIKEIDFLSVPATSI